MPYTDMTGEPLGFAEHNWERLLSVSSYLRSAASWRGDVQLDVPREFLCSVVAAVRAFDEVNAHPAAPDVAVGALTSILSDRTAVAFAETLKMVGALRAMRAALVPTSRSTPWSLPKAVSVMVIGRAVDPMAADLTLAQLAVVAALCLKLSDRAFDTVVVSIEHLTSITYGYHTFDAAGTRRIATGLHEEHWAPSRLVLVVGVHVTYFALASFQRQSAQHPGPGGEYHYRIREPVLHGLLGEQMRVAIGDALARTDEATGRTLAGFLRRLSLAISHGADPDRRVFSDKTE
jgi:hypothetical protein